MSDATERLAGTGERVRRNPPGPRVDRALAATVERVRRTPLGSRVPERWSSLQDLPFTVKDDLREHYPLGLVTVPREQLRRIHASSGSPGAPPGGGLNAARPR